MKETLQQLHEKVARKRHLNAALEDLRRQRRDLKAREETLYGQMMREQRDVDQLEGRSLAAFFYNVIGRMDEKLDKERTEAYAAAVRYDAVKRELEDTEASIAGAEAELGKLAGCEEQYQRALSEKTVSLRAAGGPGAAEILELEKELMTIESQRKELREAIFAGSNALTVADRVRAELDDAAGWSTFDLMGGGIIADMAKHGHMDKAQEELETLQLMLRRFKTELADLDVQVNIQIRLDDFTRFADHFFDGLFVDWTVRDQIHQAQNELERTYERIEHLLDRLEAMDQSAESRRRQVQAKLDQLVVRA